MCGRFAQVIKHDQLQKLERELRLDHKSDQLQANFNVAPTQTVGAFVSQDSGRYLGFFRWGLIPSWSRELPKFELINARSESLMEKASFRGGLQRRRCLIPATGFYEWRKADRQPFFIQAVSGDPLLMAGLCDAWNGPDGSYLPSLAIITMDANAHMQSLHQRMPVMLDSEQALDWLDHKNQDPAQMNKLILEASQQALDIYPVSKLVNSSRASGPECLEPSGDSAPDEQDPSLFDLLDEI